MKKNNRFSTTIPTKMTIGLDLGDRYSYFYTLDAAGENIESGRVQTSRSAMEKRFRGSEAARVVMAELALARGRDSPIIILQRESRGRRGWRSGLRLRRTPRRRWARGVARPSPT